MVYKMQSAFFFSSSSRQHQQQQSATCATASTSDTPGFNNRRSRSQSIDREYASPYIGIDFSTTSCKVGYFYSNRFYTIATVPSTIVFTPTECLVGTISVDCFQSSEFSTSPLHCMIVDVKRMLGRTAYDPIVQECINRCSPSVEVMPIDGGKTFKLQVPFRGTLKQFSIEELISFLLMKLKQLAEDRLNKKIAGCVISVPSVFDEHNRRLMRNAADIAGLQILRLIDSSTLGVISQACNDALEVVEQERHMVFVDIGAYHLSISLINTVNHVYQVVAIAGDDRCGSALFTQSLLEYCIAKFKHTTQQDISNNRPVIHRLRLQCEIAQHTLSHCSEAIIDIPQLHGGMDYKTIISRDVFNNLNQESFKKCLKGIENVLKASKLSKGDINEVILMGGSGYIPRLRCMIRDFFGEKDPVRAHRCGYEDASLYGAALEAKNLFGEDEEVQAMENFILLDALPHPIGIQTQEGRISPLIANYSTLPFKASKRFSTCADGQRAITVKLYQGKYPIGENRLLEEYLFEGIIPSQQRESTVEIIVEVDNKNNIQVSAIDLSTNTVLERVHIVRATFHGVTDIKDAI